MSSSGMNSWKRYCLTVSVLLILVSTVPYALAREEMDSGWAEPEASYESSEVSGDISGEDAVLDPESSTDNDKSSSRRDAFFFHAKDAVYEEDAPIVVEGKSVPTATASEFMGAAVSSIPILVPPGRNGLQPNLALTYNSFQGNGPLGVGWSLDLGCIQRSTKRGVDYSPDVSDAVPDFVAVINGSTSELVRRPDWGTNYYGAEIEGGFTKFQFISAGDGWVATGTDGTQYYYGSSANSQQRNPADTGQVFKWCLDKVIDTNGNFMTVTYVEDQGELYLSRIDYTGNEGLYGAPPLNSNTAVLFYWETRPDTLTRYTPHFEVKTAWRMKTIEVWTSAQQAQQVRAYKLQYYDTTGEPVPQSRLTQVQQYGTDYLISNGTITGGSSLPAIEVTYHDEETNSFDSPIVSPPDLGTDGWHWDRHDGDDWDKYITGDFNKDGRTDIFNWVSAGTGSHPNRLYLSRSNPDGSFYCFDKQEISQSEVLGFQGNNPSESVQLGADFNGDGATDLITLYYEPGLQNLGCWVYLTNPDDPDAITFITIDSVDIGQAPTWSHHGSTRHLTGDYNGDGLSDILSWPTLTNNYRILMLSNGDGSFESQNLDSVDPDGLGLEIWNRYTTAHIAGDFNGDGLSDVLKWDYNVQYGDNSLFLSKGPDQNGIVRFEKIESPLGTDSDLKWPVYDEGQITAAHLGGDYNGDGLTDVLLWKIDGTNMLFLSRGDGSFIRRNNALGAAVDLDWPADRQTAHVAQDYNGDGKTDIVMWQCNGTNLLFLSKGDGTFYRQPNPLGSPDDPVSDWWLDWTWHIGGDFDGDNKADILKWQANGVNNALWLWSCSEPQGLLTEVENGLGGKTTFSYKASSLYPDQNTADLYPDDYSLYQHTRLPYIMYLVSEVGVYDGISDSEGQPDSKTSYAYAGGYFDYVEREFCGFEYVDRTNPDNTTVESWFHQDHYKKGKPYEVKAYDGPLSSASLLGTTTFDWGEGYISNSIFVTLDRKSTTVYDGDTLTTEETYTYHPSCGKITSVVTSGEENDVPAGEEVTTETQWVNCGTWVWRKQMEQAEGQDGSVLRKTEFDYRFDNGLLDPTGSLHKKKYWLSYPGETARYLTKQFIYVDNDGYSACGNIVKKIDPLNNATTIRYDATTLTFPTIVTNALGQSVESEYHYRFGAVTRATDVNDHAMVYEYDQFGRLTQVDAPDGGRTTTQYFDSSFPRYVVTRVKEDSSHTIDSYAYFDGLGRGIQTLSFGEDGQLVAARQYYDSMGRTYRVEGPFFTTTNTVEYPKMPVGNYPWQETIYDDRSRPIEVITSVGMYTEGNPSSVSTWFDYEGLETAVEDPDGGKKKERKDYLGRIIEVTEYNEVNGQEVEYLTKYAYNAAGDLLKVWRHGNNNPNAPDVSITCDTLGRKRSMDDPDMGVWSYTYDDNGNLTTQTDAQGQTITFTYDELNRVEAKDYSTVEDEPVSYVYDTSSNGIGRLYSVTKGTITDRIDAYDAMGRKCMVIRTIGSVPYTTEYGYDLAGKITSMEYPDGYEVVYEYYPGTGLLHTVSGGGITYATIEDYKASGKIGFIAYANGTYTQYGYDPKSTRLGSIVTRNSSGTPLQSKAYVYTRAGDVRTVTDGIETITYTYAYDKLHRLVGETDTADSAGLVPGRLSGTYADADHAHAASAFSLNGVAFDYEYDANGNLVVGPDFSNPDEVVYRTLAYNADNMPTRVEQRNGYDDLVAAVDLVYDGSGARVKKMVQSGSESLTTYYIGDHYELIGGIPTTYIFAGNLRVAQIKGGVTSCFHKDHLGSSTVTTAGDQSVLERASYLPFGELRTHEAANGAVSDYKFTDQELDAATALYNYDARLYDPVVGVFIKPDSFTQDPYDPQTFNRYAYCRNNPLVYTDPSGQLFGLDDALLATIAKVAVDALAVAAKGAAMGAAVGGTTAAVTGGDIGQGMLTGAISGACIGIGGTFGVPGNVIAGAASGGINAEITGGDIGTGMLSGVAFGGASSFGVPKFTPFGESAWGAVPNRIFNSSLTGAALGAAYAGVTGGDIGQGAAMGAMGWAAGEAGNMLIGHGLGLALSESHEFKDGAVYYYADKQGPFTIGGAIIGDKKWLADYNIINRQRDYAHKVYEHELSHFPQQTALSVSYIPVHLVSQGISGILSGFDFQYGTHKYNIFERWWIDVPSY